MSQNIPDVPEFKNILSQEQIDDLRKSLNSIPRLRENIQKAARAGIDVGDQLAQLDETERQYRKLLAEL